MDFELSDTQVMLRNSIAAFMRREAPPDVISRLVQHSDFYDAALYERAAQQGWLGMLLPEIYGGGGVSMMDCAVAFEAFGRGPLPAPVFSSGVAAPQVILEAGSEEQRRPASAAAGSWPRLPSSTAARAGGPS